MLYSDDLVPIIIVILGLFSAVENSRRSRHWTFAVGAVRRRVASARFAATVETGGGGIIGVGGRRNNTQ